MSLWDPNGHLWMCGKQSGSIISHANGTTAFVDANCWNEWVPGEEVLWGTRGPANVGQLRLLSQSPYANLKGRCSVPNHPATANIDANIAAGKNNVDNTDNPDSASTEFGWEAGYLYNEFHTGGPQDYKTSHGTQYADFGNFNFGAVCGAMTNSLTYCQSAAGLGLMGRVARLNAEHDLHIPGARHQQYTGAGIPFITAPFGDQPADSAEIAAGYSYQSAGCTQ